MKFWKLYSVIGFALLLTSCIEIIDDISFNADGSGTLKYTVNLSSSKVKINSILALDSIDGKPVPTKEDFSKKMDVFQSKLIEQPGIKEVTIDQDFTNYLFKLQCDFDSIEALQSGIKAVILEMNQQKTLEGLEFDWMHWEGKQLVRSIPEFTIEKTKQWKTEDIDLLKNGVYMSITRFTTPVQTFSNPNALLSKNKMAVMIKTNPYALMHNVNLLENTITVGK